MRITRKKLVLTAANKDGGTHVDKKLTKEYEALSQDGSLGCFGYTTNKGQEVITNTIKESHLTALRQMGYEIQNSPQLLNLL